MAAPAAPPGLPPIIPPGALPSLANTLGAAYIGSVFSIALFGITTMQVLTYFVSSTKDHYLFRALIALLWVLDTVHTIFTAHGLYDYLITDYGDILAIASPNWSVLAQVFVTCFSDFIVRCIFTHRVWVLSKRNHYLAGSIMLVTFEVIALGFGFGVRGFMDKTFARLTTHSQWMLYAALGGGVVGDVMIAVSLCIFLYKSQTGFRRTDTLVNRLIIYSINTGMLTSICAAACFITFAIWPDQFIFIGIYFSLGKLYLNSLLGLLNSRETLRDKLSGVSGRSTNLSTSNHMPMAVLVATTKESTIGGNTTKDREMDMFK